MSVQVVLEEGVALPEIEAGIRESVEAEIERLPEFRRRLGRGEFPVC